MIDESETKGTKNGQFYAIFMWMIYSMARRLVPTYACMFAMHKAGMSSSAPEIGRRTQRSESTIRAHIHGITQQGLVEAQPRYRDGARISNTYLFLRLPNMPASAAAEPFVVECLPGGRHFQHPDARDSERGSLAGMRSWGDAGSGCQPLPETAGVKRNREKREPNNSDLLREVDLPLPLQRELQRTYPGGVDACLRALRQETHDLLPVQAKPLQIAVLRELCEAAKRSPVRSPAALTRTIVRANLSNIQDQVVATSSFEGELVALDDKVSRSSTPYAARINALERARLYLRACEVEPEVAQRLTEVPALPGRRGQLMAEMVRSQLAYLRASRKDDGPKASAIRSQLDLLERELKRVGAEEEAAE